MMTKQQLTQKLEDATFRGTWEEANQAQRELDLWAKQEAAFEKLKKNPALLQTMLRLKDR